MENIKNYIPLSARLALGSVFFIFGLNGFFNFLPAPQLEGQALEFLGGLGAAGYFFPLLKATEVGVGAALLAGLFVPLALTVLAPITLNIVAFHLILAPAGLPLALFILGLHLFLAWSYRSAYTGVLQARSQAAPSGEKTHAALSHGRAAA